MNEILQKFSKKLRARRKALGMTQRELAEKISYLEKAISKWESGVALPPSTLLPMLSTVRSAQLRSIPTPTSTVSATLAVQLSAR